jgi:hypothetical protein
MTLKDEDLRLIFRSYISNRESRARQDCPSLRDLSEFFEPRTRTKNKLKIIDHVTNCSACAEEFEFVRELHNYESLLVQNIREIHLQGQSRSISPHRDQEARSIWRYATVAAGALLLIVSLAIISKWDRPGETRASQSSVTLLRPSQSQPVSLPLIFEWKTLAGADSYILEIFEETLLPVWKSPEVATSILKLPEDLRNKLRLDSPYYWMITAFRNGNKLAESELRRFSLISKSP